MTNKEQAASGGEPEDTVLCRRIIEEVIKRNAGLTPNWLMDLVDDMPKAEPNGTLALAITTEQLEGCRWALGMVRQEPFVVSLRKQLDALAASPSPTASAAQQEYPSLREPPMPTFDDWRGVVMGALEDSEKALRVLSTMLRKEKLMKGFAVADEILGSIGQAKTLVQNYREAPQQGERVAELEADLRRWKANENAQMERAIRAERERDETRRELAEVRGKVRAWRDFWQHYSSLSETAQDSLNDQRHEVLKQMLDALATSSKEKS